MQVELLQKLGAESVSLWLRQELSHNAMCLGTSCSLEVGQLHAG